MSLRKFLRARIEEGRAVFFDMDGVLCDFDSKVKELFGEEKFNAFPRDEEGVMDMGKIDFETLVHIHGFKDLRPTPLLPLFNELLMEFPLKVRILTATGKPHANSVAQQKIEWIQKYAERPVSMNFTQQAKQKGEFADRKHVLVDDRLKAIGPWVLNGGIGVRFKSVEDFDIHTL